MTFLRDQPIQIGDILADFEVGRTTGVLFLSLKYHRLHPEYVFGRIQSLEKRYQLRVLLILCDVGDQHEAPVRELTKTCLINELTIIVAWSYEEAALYLKTYKVYENRPPDSIKERVDKDYASVLRSTLTTIKGVNKTDVTTLRTHFGSFSRIVHASPAELTNCPGIGPTKVRRLTEAFNKPFRQMPVKDKGKGNPAPPLPMHSSPTPHHESSEVASTASRRLASRRPRSPSPDWNIVLDLNDEDDIASPLRSPTPPRDREEEVPDLPNVKIGLRRPAERQYSPDWDIDSGVDDEDL